MRRACLFVLLGSIACSGESSPTGPDHEAFFEQRAHDVTYADVPFEIDRPTWFRTPEALETLDATAIVAAGGDLYVGTTDGVFRLGDSGDAFVRVAEGRVVDAQASGDSAFFATRSEVIELSAGSVEVRTIPTASIAAIAIDGDDVYIAEPGRVARVRFVGQGTEQIAVDTASASQLVLVGATLFGRVDDRVVRFDAGPQIDLSEVQAIGAGEGDTLLVGTADRLVRYGEDGLELESWSIGAETFPSTDFTAIHERDGVLIVGHAVGATAFSADGTDHYHSKRWIPAQQVTAVALGPDGERWIATPEGVTRVANVTTTLAERAAEDELRVDGHWRMDGFVDDSMGMADPYDLASAFTGDHDNDGLWTEMQIGTWCYAYAATGDEAFYTKARRAMDVMFLQIDIPGQAFERAGMKRGFITRSLVRDDEGAVFEDKVPRENWHLETYEGRDYYWKDDTSSDEYAGHYFGIPIFYDLCAKTDDERQAIRDRIRLTTDYLIDGDYLLVDLDGQPTTHGDWKDLGVAANGLDACTDEYGIDYAAKCIESRHGGGWLNGAEILGHLLAAWHITGDSKYYDEYERLYTEEDYGRIVQTIEDTFTVTKPAFANHSDHELAMLAFTTLIRYEPDPERRKRYEESLLFFYEYEREEHNPWQIAVIGTVHAGDVDLAGAIDTLMHMPPDWRTWRVDNEHRQDADRWPRDRHDEPQFSRVFPYDEIRTMKWNGSPYVVANGSDRPRLLAPTPYLIAYWMLRYYGLIEG
ncbi:MAG: hypothetical protein RIT81_11900 [Deltaproteobacteria bacterium]